MSQSSYLDRYAGSVMNTFGTPQRVLVRGEGCHVWDADGNRYLDLLGGIAVNALGHGHPDLVAAISKQASELIHVSNFFATPPQVELAERLDAMVAGDSGVPAQVFFTNSGTEANEAAFKLTRRTGRTRLVAAEGSFHGRSVGALAITHNPAYREPFEPLPGDVTFVPYNDADALAAAVDDTVAAIVLEPIQGENGVVEADDDYLRAAREIATENGALLWIDEVQTGVGRTGEWLAHARSGVLPDVVTFAKGLGGGVPIGACVALGDAATLLQPGNHGSTFGGNPLAAAAGLAVLSVIERDGLMAHATRVGDRFAAAVEALDLPEVERVRGRGLLRGIVLAEAIAPQVAATALGAGFIVNAPRPDVIRIAPPLVVTDAELDAFVAALPDLVSAARS